MYKNILFLSLLLLAADYSHAQVAPSQTEPFYVNLFIGADKTIYVETEMANFNEVEKKVSQLIRNRPFKIDQEVIYRIFADENLKLGYIMDVHREMLKAGNAPTQKYLLNTTQLNIDGRNWFKAIDLKQGQKF